MQINPLNIEANYFKHIDVRIFHNRWPKISIYRSPHEKSKHLRASIDTFHKLCLSITLSSIFSSHVVRNI